jgi:orotate phosphoribosyltransferase
MESIAMDRLREILMERAVRFGTFTLASGRTSDFYVDVKRIFLDPEAIDLIGQALVATWKNTGSSATAVGGMTLGADPLITSFVLKARDAGHHIPGFIVRKEPKGHGTQQYLEGAGDIPDGSDVLVLEDVVTSGGSSIKTAERCRAHGFNPLAVISVVDREEGGREAIEAAGLEFLALFSRTDLRAALDRATA